MLVKSVQKGQKKLVAAAVAASEEKKAIQKKLEEEADGGDAWPDDEDLAQSEIDELEKDVDANSQDGEDSWPDMEDLEGSESEEQEEASEGEVQEEEEEEEAEEEAEAEPEEEKPGDTEEQGPLKDQSVRVTREDGGQYFGKFGLVTRHYAGYVDLELENGGQKAHGLHEGCVQLSGGLVAPKEKLRGLQQLTNLQKDVILEVLQCNTMPWGKSPHQWLDQRQMLLGWEMLQHNWQEDTWEELLAQGNRIRLLPIEQLSQYLEASDRGYEDLASELLQELVDVWDRSEKVLCYIFGSDHWTLLTLQKGEDAIVVRYRCSLTHENEVCRERATRVMRAILGDEQRELPPRWNRWYQEPKTGVCGVAVLHWTEEEIRESRGEGFGHRVHIGDMDTRLRRFRENPQKRNDANQLEKQQLPKIPVNAPKAQRLEKEKELALAILKQKEESVKKSGSKPVEYRCSRCRWSKSGVGCDGKYCNPHKWLAKVEDLQKMVASKDGTRNPEELAALEEKLRKAFAEGTHTHDKKMNELFGSASASSGGGNSR